MNEHNLNLLITNKNVLNKKIEGFTKDKTIKTQKIDKAEIDGHIAKAENNLNFIKNIILNEMEQP